MKKLDFSGQAALVTGGSRGLGAGIARALAAAGASVIVHYRDNDEAARATADAIEEQGGTVALVKANLVNADEIRALFDAVPARLDVFVHAAALGSFKPVTALRPNQWDLTMGVNARAFLQCATAAAARMPDGGKILALSSPGAVRVVPDYGAIGISKAALEATVRSLAVELGARGINVNALSAGLIEGTSVAHHPHHDALVAQSIARTPAGRIATVDDIADVALFLCSPLARWIQGQTLVADGGAGLLF